MKKITTLVLIGEILAICVLHAIKSNHTSSAPQPSVDKKTIINKDYVLSRQLISVK